MTVYLILCAGLLGLFFGGDWLVKGASGLAARLGVSPMMIGLMIVGFGTSTPELLVSLNAALGGQPGIAIGNVVGSNIFNILGITAMITPISANPRFLNIDAPLVIGITLALASLIAIAGGLGRATGIAMLMLYAGYIGGTTQL